MVLVRRRTKGVGKKYLRLIKKGSQTLGLSLMGNMPERACFHFLSMVSVETREGDIREEEAGGSVSGGVALLSYRAFVAYPPSPTVMCLKGPTVLLYRASVRGKNFFSLLIGIPAAFALARFKRRSSFGAAFVLVKIIWINWFLNLFILIPPRLGGS